MNKKALQTIFCSVFIFNHITNKISQNLKDIVRIKKETHFCPLMLPYVKTHNHNLDTNLKNHKDKDIIIPSLYLFFKYDILLNLSNKLVI